ncbi:MAG: winged helix DNA-binding protein, partial [Gammaproteobacteria bacterium]|nr:winged helix DNA-binding protein [Gammaproteobacteria bacterium]
EQVLKYIQECIWIHDEVPTSREISEYLNLTEAGSITHIRALEKKGYIKKEPAVPRALSLTKKGEAHVQS